MAKILPFTRRPGLRPKPVPSLMSAPPRNAAAMAANVSSGEAMRLASHPVSVVKINAITVPPERMEEFADRFATRAGRVSSAAGFEAFELLRPNDGREVCLVVTRWRSEEDFQAWMKSADFSAGHAQHRTQGPVGPGSELWSFDVLEREEP